MRQYKQYALGEDANHNQHVEWVSRPIFLTPELLSNPPTNLLTLYDFCWRTCPVYAIGNYRGLSCMDIRLLTNLIIGAWYPYYVPSFGNVGSEQMCWKYDNFLVKIIGCWEEGCIKTLPEIIDAHARLCGLVEEELRMAGEETAGSRLGRKHNHNEWVVLPLFRKIMIVMDRSDWWLEGVLLVSVQQANLGHAEEEELDTADLGVINLEYLEEEEYVEKVRKGVYRLKVDRAIEVVMELQAKEHQSTDQAGLRELGKGDNSTIGCSVAEWMRETFGVADFDSFGFVPDLVWRAAPPGEAHLLPFGQQPYTVAPES